MSAVQGCIDVQATHEKAMRVRVKAMTRKGLGLVDVDGRRCGGEIVPLKVSPEEFATRARVSSSSSASSGSIGVVVANFSEFGWTLMDPDGLLTSGIRVQGVVTP